MDLSSDPHNYFLIWDNSPVVINTDLKACLFLETKNIEFHHTPENKKLSEIYNYAIDTYIDIEIIVLFDQDSMIRRKDYNKYINSIVQENIDIGIFLPKIWCRDILVSPARCFLFRGKSLRKYLSGVIRDKYFMAISSGMLFRRRAIIKANIRFNENLALYGIDTCFCIDYRKHDPKYYLMDVNISHDLSHMTTNNLELINRKRRLNVEAMSIIYKSNKLVLFIIKIYYYFIKYIKKS
jgi:hypothetical protein